MPGIGQSTPEDPSLEIDDALATDITNRLLRQHPVKDAGTREAARMARDHATHGVTPKRMMNHKLGRRVPLGDGRSSAGGSSSASAAAPFDVGGSGTSSLARSKRSPLGSVSGAGTSELSAVDRAGSAARRKRSPLRAGAGAAELSPSVDKAGRKRSPLGPSPLGPESDTGTGAPRKSGTLRPPLTSDWKQDLERIKAEQTGESSTGTRHLLDAAGDGTVGTDSSLKPPRRLRASQARASLTSPKAKSVGKGNYRKLASPSESKLGLGQSRVPSISKDSGEEGDIVTSMAKRLRQLEAKCQRQDKQLAERLETIERQNNEIDEHKGELEDQFVDVERQKDKLQQNQIDLARVQKLLEEAQAEGNALRKELSQAQKDTDADKTIARLRMQIVELQKQDLDPDRVLQLIEQRDLYKAKYDAMDKERKRQAKQIKAMEKFLSDYGMTWVGDENTATPAPGTPQFEAESLPNSSRLIYDASLPGTARFVPAPELSGAIREESASQANGSDSNVADDDRESQASSGTSGAPASETRGDTRRASSERSASGPPAPAPDDLPVRAGGSKKLFQHPLASAIPAIQQQAELRRARAKQQGDVELTTVSEEDGDQMPVGEICKTFEHFPKGAVDYNELNRCVGELNRRMEEDGKQIGPQAKKGAGATIFSFVDAASIKIIFFQDGVLLGEQPFATYGSSIANLIIKDVLDGFFPFILQKDYPDGVKLESVDHTRLTYQEWLSTQPRDVQSFLNKLPERVVRNGQLVEVRSSIAARIGRGRSNSVPAVSAEERIQQIEDMANAPAREPKATWKLPPGEVSFLNEDRAADAPTCRIAVRIVPMGRVTVKMEPTATIRELRAAIDQFYGMPEGQGGARRRSNSLPVEPLSYELMAPLPDRRVYDDLDMTLEAADLMPASTIQLREQKTSQN